MKKIIAILISLLISGPILANNAPPGLEGKGGGEFPKGLEKNEKTPAGWMHGKKMGWSRHHGHHRHHHVVTIPDKDHDND